MGLLDLKDTISGIGVTLQPYTEKRRTELDKLNAEILAFINSFPESTPWDEIPLAKKAPYYKRKADILIRFDEPVTDSFFASDEFEFTKLREAERLFMTGRVYL